MARTTKKSDAESSPPAWEWILAAIGVLLVAGVISAMIYRGVANDSQTPHFEIAVESIEPTSDGHVVKFGIKNTGQQTAASVNIDGVLSRGSQQVENGSVTLAYVPGNSTREGGLFFKSDPRQFELNIRVTGYEKP